MIEIQFTLRSILLSNLFALGLAVLGLRVWFMAMPYGARHNRTYCVVKAMAI